MKTIEFPSAAGRSATAKELEIFNEDHSKLPEFYIAYVDIEPNKNDIEPPIGRREDGKLRWDNKRREGWYNSIDIKNVVNSRGTLHEIKRMYLWEHHTKIFEKWMNKTLEIKDEGSRLNKLEEGT